MVFTFARDLLIIKVNNTEIWDQHFPKFKEDIIKRSLRWPTAESLNNIGIPKGVNHPKNKFEITISDKEFKDWKNRFIEVLKST
ncbi:Tn7-like element transposition protein TnsE [Acinetobacter sp. YH12116]|uniref:Tn7-like element transposition protein TnsE n=1 Tax=Acinetobacter sp. YH12116 TaxID=2601103 RepID=UPI0035A0488D